jgi:hypothetical protein
VIDGEPDADVRRNASANDGVRKDEPAAVRVHRDRLSLEILRGCC